MGGSRLFGEDGSSGLANHGGSLEIKFYYLDTLSSTFKICHEQTEAPEGEISVKSTSQSAFYCIVGG